MSFFVRIPVTTASRRRIIHTTSPDTRRSDNSKIGRDGEITILYTGGAEAHYDAFKNLISFKLPE